MSTILGRIEYGGDKSFRYFIHSDTAGWSSRPLFKGHDEAWIPHRQASRGAAMEAPAPAQSRRIFAVKKVLVRGLENVSLKTPYPPPDVSHEALFGLATGDRLLWPLSDGYSNEPRWSLLQQGEVLHIAVETGGGFDGLYDQPICSPDEPPIDNARPLTFAQMFGQELDLCPHCTAKLFQAVV